MCEYFEMFKDIGEVLGLGIHFSRLAFLFLNMHYFSSYIRTTMCIQTFNSAIANLAIVTISESYPKTYIFRKYISLWGVIETISVSEKYVISCFFVLFLALITSLNLTVFLIADINMVHLYSSQYFQLVIVASLINIIAGGGMGLLYLLKYSSVAKNMTELMLIIRRKFLSGKHLCLSY